MTLGFLCDILLLDLLDFIVRLDMKETLYNSIQIILSFTLTVAVLLQQKGSGLSQILGGTSNVYSTRRGIDKMLHYTTIVIAFLFFIFSVVRLVA